MKRLLQPSSGVAYVVVSRHPERLGGIVRALTRGADRRGEPPEVLVAWTAPGPVPVVPGARLRATFPALGGAYAVNQVLPWVRSPRLVVVPDTGALPAARLRLGVLDTSPLLSTGGLDHALPLPLAVAEAATRQQRMGRPLRVAGRRLARRRESRPSSIGPLRHLPAALGVQRSEVVPLAASARAKNHLIYAVAGGRVLHLYAAPSPRLLRGVEDRVMVRERAAGARVPRLLNSVAGSDCLWVLEDAVEGTPPAGGPATWWREVSQWLIHLAGPPGPPLADTPGWHPVRVDALQQVPAEHRRRAARALDRVERWPSRHQHGDLQPKNVLLTPAGPAAVDWEGVWLHGVPGLDLLFLALLATGAPDPTLLPLLVAGEDAADRPLHDALRQLDLTPTDLPALVVACLAIWTRGEVRRNAQLGNSLTRQPSTWFTAQWARLVE